MGAGLLCWPLMCCYLQQVTDLLQLASIRTVYKQLGYKMHDFTGYMVGPPMCREIQKIQKFKSPQKCLPPLLHFPFQWWGVCSAQCGLRLYIFSTLSVLLLLLPLVFIFETCKNHSYIRDIRKVRKRQHQYHELGHTQGEIKKKPAKSTLALRGG